MTDDNDVAVAKRWSCGVIVVQMRMMSNCEKVGAKCQVSKSTKHGHSMEAIGGEGNGPQSEGGEDGKLNICNCDISAIIY